MNLYLLKFVAVVLILRLPQKTGADLLNKHCILQWQSEDPIAQNFYFSSSLWMQGQFPMYACIQCADDLKSLALFPLFHDSHFLSLLSYAI